MSLEDLKKKREKWVEANRENNFEEGIKKLLTDLYPDNAHFIFELLQNAEDPGATVVRFTLDEDWLEFEHNGERLFNVNDVESITSIGVSTKRNDPTKIGKFGVGFKAVFAYTNTPEIYSGDFKFRIRDLVVPEKIENYLGAHVGCVTRFRFPFNRPSKGRLQARKEVESALRSLSDNTLLFLSNIHTIEYLLPGDRLGRIHRVEEGNGRIEISSIRPDGSESKSHWLRFDKRVNVVDDDGVRKDHRIAIAYALAAKPAKKVGGAPWQVVPLDRGQVSIYFPAEKETSGLRFHVHAPFASTVARDSVRQSEGNDRLIGEIARLAADSLHSIKSQGMLSVDFMAVLPNLSDGLPRMYAPILEHILAAYKKHDLTPTKSGGHARAGALFRGPARISEVVDDDDLAILEGRSAPLWAANPAQTNQREDRFLESLEIPEWGWRELGGVFALPSQEKVAVIERWLDRKEDPWLMRFYALLGEAMESHQKYMSSARRVRLVRSEKQGEEDRNVLGEEAYFSASDGRERRSDVRFVKRACLEASRSENQRRLARFFLEEVGVRPLDEKALLELRLGAYSRNEVEPGQEHLRDIRTFIDLWKRDSSVSELFQDVPFLLGHDGAEDDIWLPPSNLCLDEPFVPTGLSNHVAIHGMWPVSSVYEKSLSALSLKGFVEFLKAIGISHELEVVRVGTCRNPNARRLREKLNQGARWTSSGTDHDYSILDLENYLACRSISASRLVWNALIKADGRVKEARFRPNQQYAFNEAPSQLVHHLSLAEWIPNREGVFRAPPDMTANNLRRDFPFDDRNGLLTAIGFGFGERVRSAEFRARNEAAQALGFSDADEAAELAVLIRASGKTPAEISALLAQPCDAELPVRSVQNPQRRRKGLLEDKEGAPDRESVKRERSVIEGSPDEVAKARAYLRPMYTNADGQLICQCCRLEMPFKINGMHFFEAVSLTSSLKQHLYRCRLALCPTCAAMYRYARQSTDDEMIECLAENCADADASSAEVDVNLAGSSHKLWFTGTHFFDVNALLRSIREGSS